MKNLIALLFTGLAAWSVPGSALAAGSHGIAMHGTPALPPDFAHFPYVNPDAPKTGRLTLGQVGTFDSLNPFIIKGVVPPGLRGYVYESLMVRGLSEPFTLYGLIAESIEVPDDRSSVTFNLRPEAKFTDGKPITAADVIHSHETLRDLGAPYFRSHYKKVVRVETNGPHHVRFVFADGADREIPLIMGLMPILPKHLTTKESFDKTTLVPPIGSGPYRIDADKLEAGRTISFVRDPNYWGAKLAASKGRYNFDEVRYIFFRDSTALFESFKVGEIDLRPESDPGQWAEGYGFPAVKDGRIVKREIDIAIPAGMAAFVFNSRRPVFADARVRRAVTLLFDFEYINRSLFHGLFQRTNSYFERSALSSHNRPADERERVLLKPFMSEIKPEIMSGTFTMPKTDGSGQNRGNLRAAFKLLREAGYAMKGTTLTHTETGKPLAFEFLVQTRQQERLTLAFANTLKRMGIRASIRKVDNAQYWSRLKTFDYDMIQWNWASSLSPGNEQINRFGSAAAAREGSLNFANVKSPAADAMMLALLSARTAEEFTSAVRAYDRALLSGDHVIPLYHLPKQWLAHWKHLKGPATNTLWGYDIDSWWSDKAN